MTEHHPGQLPGQHPGRMAFAHADRLEPGDRLAPFTLPDAEGKPVNPFSDRLAGRPLLLVFECDHPDRGAAFEGELMALQGRAAVLAGRDALVLAITRRSVAENRVLARRLGRFAVLSDSRAAVYGYCGLDPASVGRHTVTLALDGNLRVLALIDGGGASRWSAIEAALNAAAEPDAEAPLGGHAPVLVLPRVLTPADCAELIEIWHRPVRQWDGDGFTTRGFHEAKGDFKVRNKDYGHVVQMVVRDERVQKYLDAKLQRRVMPEIAKTFQTAVSRREEYRIACYDAAEQGSLGPHRDNPTKETQHRRFTLAVTLNGGAFEGGGLQFREYSRRPYRVATGTAIVWSCSLLHEVLAVTAGRRFILGTHLFGN